VRFVSSFIIVRFLPEFHIRCVLAFVYTLPLSVIAATTNQALGLNVITELIIGYALPGRPIAMMLFKTWGYITMYQAIMFISNLKLAHYMKIAHRPMFFCQVVATIVAGTVQLGVQAWMFSNIEDLCDADQKNGFICPYLTVFGNASILVSSKACRVGTYFFVAQRCCVAVGCHWAATSIFARSALLWPRLLLPCRHPCTIVPVDIAQEVQNRFPQVHQFPSRLRQHEQYASCDPP
jgi:OPT family oligopeptide transporter